MTARRKHKRTHRLPDEAFASFEAGDAKLWNQWRQASPDEPLDFRGLRGPDPVPGAWLRHANLERSDCSGAAMQHVLLDRANLSEANFKDADLRNASLERTDLSDAIFDGADLRGADLRRAILYQTSLKGTDLSRASVADAFLRSVKLDENTRQQAILGLTRVWFTPQGHLDASSCAVDDIRAAALLSLLGERGAVSALIDAGSRTVVLILGRFGRRRLPVLRRLADALQTRGKIPIIFDFPGPQDRELSDTVRLLATLSEFIVVDLSDPRSVPLELQATIPGLMIPVVPIIEAGRTVFAMFQDLQRRYFWVLPPVAYADKTELAGHVDTAILQRVRKIQRQIRRRRKELAATPPAVSTFGPGEAGGEAIDWIIK